MPNFLEREMVEVREGIMGSLLSLRTRKTVVDYGGEVRDVHSSNEEEKANSVWRAYSLMG